MANERSMVARLRQWLEAMWPVRPQAMTPVAGARQWIVGRSAAGVWVDADSALRNAVVWACVQYLSKTIASLPWRVHRETAEGSVRASAHPADWLLYRRPCDEHGAFSWRQTMVKWVLLHGNAYAEIQRDNAGRPYALWPIHPGRVSVCRDEDDRLSYEVWRERGGKVVVPMRDMFHVRGLGDGPVGCSVIEYAAQSIGWAQATELFGATYFAEGMNPSGVVEVPATTKLTPEGQDELRAEMERLYAGPRGKRLAIMDGGMVFKKIASNPDESQFIETRQHQVEEICRWFGVPPHKVMHMLRSTFSNIEHQSIEVVGDAVLPLAKSFEEEADFKLLGDNRAGYYTKIDLRALLRGDHQSRAQYYRTMVEIGAMTLNEVRALEDLNQVANGNTRFVSQNLQALGEDGMPVDRRAERGAIGTREEDDGQRLPN